MADYIAKSFAYDLSKNILSKGEIYDYDVLNQSIEVVLSTIFGERIFNPFSGSTFSLNLFEGMTSDFLNSTNLLDTAVDAISLWDNRFTIDKNASSITPDPDNNTITVNISYIVNKTNVRNVFLRKIRY